VVWSCYDWNAQMSAMPGMWVQSAVCADVARRGSGMLGMWAWLSRQLHYNGTLVLPLLFVPNIITSLRSDDVIVTSSQMMLSRTASGKDTIIFCLITSEN